TYVSAMAVRTEAEQQFDALVLRIGAPFARAGAVGIVDDDLAIASCNIRRGGGEGTGRGVARIDGIMEFAAPAVVGEFVGQRQCAYRYGAGGDLVGASGTGGKNVGAGAVVTVLSGRRIVAEGGARFGEHGVRRAGDTAIGDAVREYGVLNGVH